MTQLFGQSEKMNSTTCNKSSTTKSLKGTWYRVECDKCLRVGEGWSILAFQASSSVKSDVDIYKKTVEGTWEWIDVGELGEMENKSWNCIVDQLKGLDGFKGQPTRSKVQ